MATKKSEIDMEALRSGVRKVLAYEPPLKSEQEEQPTQHRHRRSTHIKEPNASSYKAEKR